MKNLKFILVAVVAMFISAIAVAQEKPKTLTLPSVVGSNMVLQHSATINIWGWAKPKATVKINPSWLNLKKPLKVKANAEGFWILPVQTLGASYDTHSITISCKKEVKELENILFGEVWLCAGQSNMEWAVRRDPDMKSEIKAEKNPYIRLYCTGRISAETPQNDVPAQKKYNASWTTCTPKAVSRFSAVGYGFGKELQEALNVPIGLIDASYGGTPVEGWLSAEYLANNPKVAAVANKSKNKRWRKKISHLHNANIYPIHHTTIAGTIWYQGCSNVSYGGYYTMLNHLIKSWREEFRNPEMPFYIVEIAPHTYTGIRGALLRETQARTAAKNINCEIVGTNDQNQIPGDIHPPKKADVAHRLAQVALGAHYQKTDAEFRNPAYKSKVVEGNAIRVSFKNVPTSLVKKGEGRINGFQLGVKDPNNDKKLIFTLAEAQICEDNTILVSAEGVTNPVAVRYCFNEDMGNVFSAEGLPLLAFRSDKSNRSLSARPYIEKPSEIAIKFEGEGYARSTFAEGGKLWAGTDFVMSDEYPKEFEGFELLVPAAVAKGEMSAGGKVTALADGKIYMFTSISGATRNAPWRVLTASYSRCAKDGKKRATFYIVEREVKAGEVVELPKFKNRWGTMVLAKSIVE